MRREPYFMQQLHKQRERAANVLWEKFNGDFNAYHRWSGHKREEELRAAGFVLKKTPWGTTKLVPLKDRIVLSEK